MGAEGRTGPPAVIPPYDWHVVERCWQALYWAASREILHSSGDLVEGQIMRHLLWIWLVLCMAFPGCSKPAAEEVAAGTTEGAVVADGPDQSAQRPTTPSPSPAPAASDSGQPVPIENGVVKLTPANTLIQFVGTHAGDRPDPRTGRFQAFTGSMQVDPASETLRSISVKIDTTSLIAEGFDRAPDLTNHLKSPDFFDVREYPTAEFKSTKIEPGQDGKSVQVTGMLLLHGVTKEITFPATVKIQNDALTMLSQFTIDRSEFGMTFGPDRVENDVAMTIAVGQKIKSETQSTAAPASGRGPGSFDPQQMFARRDANSDGKLSGDEIPDQMRENLTEIDADGDGSVTLEEFQERVRQRRQQRGEN